MTDFGEPWDKQDTVRKLADCSSYFDAACIERAVACVNFCQHLSTETLEALTKERVGAATLIQWIRKNPTFDVWYEYGDEYDLCIHDVCIQCDHAVSSTQPHAEDCLLKQTLDIVGTEI